MNIINLLIYCVALVCMPAFVLFWAASADPGPASDQTYAAPGTVAHVRPDATTGDEIRLVEPDGSSDRLLWKTNVPGAAELKQGRRLTCGS